jgi:hypothetical protein
MEPGAGPYTAAFGLRMPVLNSLSWIWSFGILKLVVDVDGHWVARARSFLTLRSSRPASPRAGDAARANFLNI